MAKKSRMSVIKRQREVRKAEKAARKRAKRHGVRVESSREPTPTPGISRLLKATAPKDTDSSDNSRR